MQRLRVLSRSPEETFRIGQRLGHMLKEGDSVALYGELGAGKTIFTKGIASAFSIPERDITSASFTIISEHKGIMAVAEKTIKVPFYHIDLYRVDEPGLDSLGLEEYLGSGISVIEWAERLRDTPESLIKVNIKILDTEEREILIEGINEEDWNNR